MMVVLSRWIIFPKLHSSLYHRGVFQSQSDLKHPSTLRVVDSILRRGRRVSDFTLHDDGTTPETVFTENFLSRAKQNLAKSNDITRYVSIDTEITGLSHEDKLAAIACIPFDAKGTTYESFYTTLNPECPMPYEAFMVNKRDDETLRNSPLWEDIKPQFHECVKGHIPVFHNAQFDNKFLQMHSTLLWKNSTCPMGSTS